MSFIAIKHRRDTAANWTANNPTLLDGQFGIETDSYTDSGGFRYYKIKLGNGSVAWNSLPYMRLAAIGGGGGGATAFIDLTDVPGAYTGQGGKYLKVTELEDGVEFEPIEAADLPTGIDAAKIGDGSVSNAEFQYLSNVTSDIQTQINGKQAAGSYQPLDSDLTSIAGLTPTDGDSIWRVAGAWLNRTAAQAKTLLGLVKADVGLGNVDNTSDANKPVSTAQQAALDLKQNLDTELTAFAGLTSAADKLPYFTGAGTMSTADFTALARNLVALAGPSAVRFYKVNADNTVSLRTAAEMLSDIGAQASGSYLVTTNNLSDLDNAGTARTNLGATTVGGNIFTATNPGAVTFIRVNADNTITFRTVAETLSDLGAASSTFIDAISGFIETVADKTYKIVIKCPFACTINETVTMCASGTATATFKINTTALGGTANSVSNSEQTQTHSSANSISAGDDIQITISSNSSCLDMSFTIKITRTI